MNISVVQTLMPLIDRSGLPEAKAKAQDRIDEG